jgi:hypothetical protein
LFNVWIKLMDHGLARGLKFGLPISGALWALIFLCVHLAFAQGVAVAPGTYQPVAPLGNGLLYSGGLKLTDAVNPQAGASYTIQASDAALTVNRTNSGAMTDTLPVVATSGFGVGFGFNLCTAAGSDTLTSSSNINNAGSLVIPPYTCVAIADLDNATYSAFVPLGGHAIGTSGATIGLLNGNNTYSGNDISSGTWNHQGVNTFAAVLGSERTVTAGSTDTLLSTDCGKTVLYNNAAYTVTIPAAIVPTAGTSCQIDIITDTANKVTVTGTAVSAATLVSADGYTGTRNLAGSGISLKLINDGAAKAYLLGFGS